MSIYDIGKYYDENMNEIETKDMITTHLHIPSTPFENQWTGGEDGIAQRYSGSYVVPKTIEAHIFLKAYDYFDYELLRDYLYGIFGFNNPFYVVSKVQPGKRHKVVLESDFMPERLGNVAGMATIPFITAESPYAESIGTTQDIQRNGISANDKLWGFGMGLIADDDSLVYTHSGTSFKIYNAGNVPVHPFEQYLKITIKDMLQPSDHIEIRNETTGDIFIIYETPTGEIVLDGPNITSNGLNYYRSTNGGFIEIAPGWNEFTLSGVATATVEFDFRYYYK